MPMVGAACVITVNGGGKVCINHHGPGGDVGEGYRLVLLRHHQNGRRNWCSQNVLLRSVVWRGVPRYSADNAAYQKLTSPADRHSRQHRGLFLAELRQADYRQAAERMRDEHMRERSSDQRPDAKDTHLHTSFSCCYLPQYEQPVSLKEPSWYPCVKEWLA